MFLTETLMTLLERPSQIHHFGHMADIKISEKFELTATEAFDIV